MGYLKGNHRHIWTDGWMEHFSIRSNLHLAGPSPQTIIYPKDHEINYRISNIFQTVWSPTCPKRLYAFASTPQSPPRSVSSWCLPCRLAAIAASSHSPGAWRILEDAGGWWRMLEDPGRPWMVLEDLEDPGTLEDAGGHRGNLAELWRNPTYSTENVPVKTRS